MPVGLFYVSIITVLLKTRGLFMVYRIIELMQQYVQVTLAFPVILAICVVKRKPYENG